MTFPHLSERSLFILKVWVLKRPILLKIVVLKMRLSGNGYPVAIVDPLFSAYFLSDVQLPDSLIPIDNPGESASMTLHLGIQNVDGYTNYYYYFFLS